MTTKINFARRFAVVLATAMVVVVLLAGVAAAAPSCPRKLIGQTVYIGKMTTEGCAYSALPEFLVWQGQVVTRKDGSTVVYTPPEGSKIIDVKQVGGDQLQITTQSVILLTVDDP